MFHVWTDFGQRQVLARHYLSTESSKQQAQNVLSYRGETRRQFGCQTSMPQLLFLIFFFLDLAWQIEGTKRGTFCFREQPRPTHF